MIKNNNKQLFLITLSHVFVTFYLLLYIFIQRQKKIIPDLIYILFSLGMFLHWFFLDGHCVITFLYKKQYKKIHKHSKKTEKHYKDPIVFLDLKHFINDMFNKQQSIFMKDCGSSFIFLWVCFSLFIITHREQFFNPFFIIIIFLLTSLFNIYLRTYYYNKKHGIENTKIIQTLHSLKIISPIVYICLFFNIFYSFQNKK